MRNSKLLLYAKIFMNFLVAVFVCLLLIYVAPVLITFFWPFIVGWIIAMIANPLVRFFEKRLKIVRKHSSAIIIILVLAVVISLLYLIGSLLVRETVDFVKNLPTLYKNFETEMNQSLSGLVSDYDLLPQGIKHFIGNFGDSINDIINNSFGNMNFSFNSATLLVKNVADIFLMVLITILSSYFFIADRDKIIEQIKTKTPYGIQRQYHMIMDNFVHAIGGYIKAQLKIMVLIFIYFFLGLLFLDLNYTVLIAIGIAIFDFLPIFGAGGIIVPWALYEFLTGNANHGIFLLILYVGSLIIRHVSQPKMVGDSIGLSPLATLIFMFIGYRIAGILGLILGIPVGMIVIKFYENGLFDRLLRGVKIIIHDFNDFRKF